MKLAIAQMVFGLIIVGRCLYFSHGGIFPGLTPFPLFTFANIALGLAVLGCGVAQLLKARE